MILRFVNKKTGKERTSKDYEVQIIKKRKIKKPEDKNPAAKKDDSNRAKET